MQITARRLGLLLIIVFILGLISGFTISQTMVKEEKKLPQDLQKQLGRFKFINRSINATLKDYKVIGVTIGTYELGGKVFETYVLGFEDRPNGASADLDYLDLLIEIKRIVGERRFVIRMAQLGLDRIDVYLDEEYVGSARPIIELEVRF